MSISAVSNSIYGLAVGDALGVPYETESFEEMHRNPCVDMIGYFHHNQPPGTWSDDTSMTLCSADSLCKGFDPDDMMKKFCQWRMKKYYTAGGHVFDVGRTCRKAMDLYLEGYPPEYCGDSSIYGNGNGALMRIAPVVLYQYYLYPADDTNLHDFLKPIHEASSLTHAHEIGLICCGLYGITIRELLMHSGETIPLLTLFLNAYQKGKQTYYDLGGRFREYIEEPDLFISPDIVAQAQPENLPQWGYALNTWNIAVWSLLNSSTYRECVLNAVNLGGDTDSNAAVAGSIAGIIYGKNSIPEELIDTLQNKKLLDLICNKLETKLEGGETENTHEEAHITQLQKKFKGLSMKASTTISIGGHTYNNMASALYALSSPEEYRNLFENVRAKNARKIYNDIPHYDEDVERMRMNLTLLIRARCEQHPDFKQLLLDTGKRKIIYDTSGSHNNILGHCRCSACKDSEFLNLYGTELVNAREELVKKSL